MEKLKTVDFYTNETDCIAWNEVICGSINISINLPRLMERKNMSVTKLIKKINRTWLQEFICGLHEMDGNWNEEMCDDNFCPIYRTVQRMEMMS